MAAAEYPNYIQIIVATLPVILSPIVVWFLSRSRISTEAATLDYLNKRLDVLERMNKLHTQLTEGPIRPFLDMEIEHCRAFLHQPPAFVSRDAEVAVGAPQSRWTRFFLTQPAASVRKRVFKGLFYFFFGTAMLSLLAVVSLVDDPNPLETGTLFVSLFGFYFGLALLFRLGAR